LSIAIFGGAVSGDIVVSVVLIVAGIILTLRSLALPPKRARSSLQTLTPRS
jgi:hypothetical protein